MRQPAKRHTLERTYDDLRRCQNRLMAYARQLKQEERFSEADAIERMIPKIRGLIFEIPTKYHKTKHYSLKKGGKTQ